MLQLLGTRLSANFIIRHRLRLTLPHYAATRRAARGETRPLRLLSLEASPRAPCAVRTGSGNRTVTSTARSAATRSYLPFRDANPGSNESPHKATTNRQGSSLVRRCGRSKARMLESSRLRRNSLCLALPRKLSASGTGLILPKTARQRDQGAPDVYVYASVHILICVLIHIYIYIYIYICIHR